MLLCSKSIGGIYVKTGTFFNWKNFNFGRVK